MNRMVLRVATGVLCMFMLTACDSVLFGNSDQEGRQLVGEPIPTRTPNTEGTGEESIEKMPVETPQPTPQVLTVTISAAGDCSLGNYQEQEYAYSFRQAYDRTEDEGYFLRMCGIFLAVMI